MKVTQQQRSEGSKVHRSPPVEAVIGVDETGAVTLFSGAAEAMFGYRRDEIVGRKVSVLLPKLLDGADDMPMDVALKAYCTDLVGAGCEVSGRRKSGDRLPLFAVVERWEFNERPHFVGILRDLTGQAQQERELAGGKRLEALGRLAGGIAHDFNNLLLPIITLSELTMQEVPKCGEAHENLDHILTAAKRGKLLVDQIFAFSQGKATMHRLIELADLVQEALALFRASLPDAIRVETHFDEEPCNILGDPTQLHEMLMNLLTNAAKAIGDGDGRIILTLERIEVSAASAASAAKLTPGSYARLRIRDTGCGMDKDTLSKIFDPFFTTGPSGFGTGMGLAIVHSIVAGHDGAVTVSSKPGQGATFEVYLPMRTTGP